MHGSNHFKLGLLLDAYIIFLSGINIELSSNAGLIFFGIVFSAHLIGSAMILRRVKKINKLTFGDRYFLLVGQVLIMIPFFFVFGWWVNLVHPGFY
jgi:hypothetical protein